MAWCSVYAVCVVLMSMWIMTAHANGYNASKVGASSPVCIIKGSDGNTYDFNSLNTGANYVATEVDSTTGNPKYLYYFSICGALVQTTDPDLSSCAQPPAGFTSTAVCQFDPNGNPPKGVSNTGSWPESVALSQLSSSPNTFLLHMPNGAKCTDYRVTDVLLVCDPSAKPIGTKLVATEPTAAGCKYQITVPTALACAGGGGGGGDGGGGGGLSGGSIFCMVVLIPLGVYWIAGCIFMWRRHPEEKFMNWCPNRGFWCALPGLMKAGCMYTWHGICKLTSRCTGKNYEGVSEGV